MEINIKKLKEKSEEEFEKFYHLYINRIYTIIYRVVKDEADAEDLTLEVMMKVYDKIDTFREKSKLSTWVYRIAYNHSLGFLRKKKPVETLEDYEKPLDEKHLAWIDRQEIVNLLRKKLMELPEKQRVSLTLFYFEELSHKEISYTMGVDIGAIKNYIHRGKENLKNKLGEILEGVKDEH